MSVDLATPPAPVQPVVPIATEPVTTGQGELARFRAAKAEGTPFVETVPAAPVAEPVAPVAPVVTPEPVQLVNEANDAGIDPSTGAPWSNRQKYINSLIRAQTRAELERDQFKQRLELLERGNGQPPAAAPAVAPTRPKPVEDQVGTQYATYGDYVEDLADWKVEQREQARTHAENGSRAEQAHRDALTAYETTVKAARTRHADFDEVVTRPLPAPLTPTIENALLASEVGGDMAYHLTTHPEEYLRIRALPPGRALMALGALETQVRTAATPASPAPIQTAPPAPPMAPVGGSASAGTPDPKSMSLKQFRQLKPKFGMTA